MVERKRGADNGKYALVTYLVEKCSLTIEQIIDLKPQEALELFPPDDKAILEELKKYITQNSKNINNKGYFFPGRGQDKPQVSERALLHELHFWLDKQGRSLKELGLTIRQADKKEKPEKKENILDWAKSLLNTKN